MGAKIADAIKKTEGIVDILNGIDNTISGPATLFQVDPTIATRAGFSPEEVDWTRAPSCRASRADPRRH